VLSGDISALAGIGERAGLIADAVLKAADSMHTATFPSPTPPLCANGYRATGLDEVFAERGIVCVLLHLNITRWRLEYRHRLAVDLDFEFRDELRSGQTCTEQQRPIPGG
jgi:hypothetical protein